jgi:hypothetical protein
MPRIIGKEVLKNIVAMAYEMDVADRIQKKVKQELLEFSYEPKYQTTFRDDKQVLEDITKLWKVVHTNKKYYEKGDEDDGQGDTYYSKEKYPLTVSGRFIAYFQIVKYDHNEGVDCYIDTWITTPTGGFLRDIEQCRIDDAPTTTTIDIIQRHIAGYNKAELRKLLSSVYEFRFRGLGKNRRAWEERLVEWKERQLLVEKLSS